MGTDNRKNGEESKTKRHYKTTLTPNGKEHSPLIHKPNSYAKDLGDGQGISSDKKHRKTASSSSYAFVDTRRKKAPPWETENGTSKAIPVRGELGFYLSKLQSEWKKYSWLTNEFIPYTKKAERALVSASNHGHIDVIRFWLSTSENKHFKGEPEFIYCNDDELLEFLYKTHSLKPIMFGIPFHGVYVSLLHLVSHLGLSNSVKTLIDKTKFSLSANEVDSEKWMPLHYAAARSHVDIVMLLLDAGADPNAGGPYRVTPLHIAAYLNRPKLAEALVDGGGDLSKSVTLNYPRHSDDFSTINELPNVVQFNSKQFCTPFHWIVHVGNNTLIEKCLRKGAEVHVRDLEGRTPLGLALLEGQVTIVKSFVGHNISLSDEDKNWRRLQSEESAREVVKILEETNLAGLDCSSKEGFTLMHLAASRGYLGLLGDLLNRGVNPDMQTVRGETPIFAAAESNQQACFQLLYRNGCNIGHVTQKGSSILHIASKFNNFAVLDMMLNIITRSKCVDVNLTDSDGFTAIYYAINSSRYDIVQRLVQFCVAESIHVKATQDETLLQFYTERNLMGQYDNAIVRVLELEKALHPNQVTSELCIRGQLGTTEGSTKARDQMAAMYESTKIQQHCWNFWMILTCFIFPLFLYYLDVYTDVILAVEYYNDYIEASQPDEREEKNFGALFRNMTESQSKVNLMLTLFFILFPMLLLSLWCFYVHVTQADVLPCIKRLTSFKKAVIYFIIFFLPFGPIITYIENAYAQVKYINVTSAHTKQKESMSMLSLTDGDTVPRSKKANQILRNQYNLKHIAQMRVAINNVLEATLESAFQLILQLYIVGTQYSQLRQLDLGDITIGSILALTPTQDSQSRLSKQVLSVLISLVSLTWSFTAYHRFSKLGGLRVLWSLPLLFAIFFQIVSRAIACTVFTLAYTWRIFICLGVHLILVCLLKIFLEKQSPPPNSPIFTKTRLFSSIRPYFYVILGSFTSTFVYFRIERPLGDKETLYKRSPSFLIQVLFLVLALVENVCLLAVAIPALGTDYDFTFKIVTIVLCLLSFMIGIILQWVYYGCFGHPWVNINGPGHEKTADGAHLLTFYVQRGESRWIVRSCCDCSKYKNDDDSDVEMVVSANEVSKTNGTVRI